MFKQFRAVLSNIFLAIGGVLVALFLLEMVARFLPPPFQNPESMADVCADQTGWRGKPYYTTTVATGDIVHDLALNSVGMHDTEHPLTKQPDTFRILLLGDSFGRAHQVKESETAHQVLEDSFNSQTKLKAEVINSGVDGWGTGQELLYYRNEGRFYHPDVVILMFFLGNDVKDNLPGRGVTVGGQNCYMPYFVLNGNQLDPAPWLYAPGLTPSLGQSSWVQKSLSNLLGSLHHSSRLYNQIEPFLVTPPVKASMLDFYIGGNKTFDYALHLTVDLVKQLHSEVKQDGALFKVVLISPIDLVEFSRMNATQRQTVYQKLPVMKRAEEIEPPNQMLVKIFSADGIEVLDLLPLFSQYMNETSESLYLKGDKHWNVAGNRLAGEAIYHWLSSNGGKR